MSVIVPTSEKDVKITVRLPRKYVLGLDLLVKFHEYSSRNAAVTDSVKEILDRQADKHLTEVVYSEPLKGSEI